MKIKKSRKWLINLGKTYINGNKMAFRIGLKKMNKLEMLHALTVWQDEGIMKKHQAIASMMINLEII
jgi:hypothetical protein